jgi:NAD(P)-dependent dehydrogenase (short-subunit alcohol dehydrogenase family)
MNPGAAVLVTGGSMGLGLETSLHLAERGWTVYATYLREEERPAMEAAARDRQLLLHPVLLDVRDQMGVDTVVRTVVDEAGGLFGLINNAGISQHGCFEDVSDAEMRALWEVNVLGTMWVTRAALPWMQRARRGRIVTLSSVAGRMASFSRSGYCSTKFALEGWANSLSLELAPHGIHTTLIEPGYILTPHWTLHKGLTRGAQDPTSPYFAMFERHEALSTRLLRASRIRPIHVAKAIARALSDEPPRARYMVGAPARLVTTLRRWVPEPLFERMYYGTLMRRLSA